MRGTVQLALAPIGDVLGRVSAWFTTRLHAPTSVSVVRAAVGICGLSMYLADYSIRHLLFNPDVLRAGPQSPGNFEGLLPTLYSISGSTMWFEAVFHLGLVAALLVVVGVGGRVGLFVHYCFIWSLYSANPIILDGGDNLVMILGLVLLLTRCYDRLNLLDFLVPERRQRVASPVGFVAHNTGVLLIAVQICTVYVMAGLYKVQGQLWQDGTALYYILRTPEFYWPGVTEYVFKVDALLVLGAYATVWLAVYFPLLVLVRRLRLPAVLLMSGFHVSIAVLMGLTSFALIMVACDLVFVNGHVEQAGRLARRAGRGLHRRVRSALGRPIVATMPESRLPQSQVVRSASEAV